MKSSFHFVDRLRRVLVERFEVLDAILDEKRACNRSMHPLDSSVSKRMVHSSVRLTSASPLRELVKPHVSEYRGAELAINVENTFSKDRCHGFTAEETWRRGQSRSGPRS